MIDLKKIAEKLREIASFCAPDDGCTNAIYDAQIAIANELDPPEPKPEPLPMASTHDGLGNKFMRDCLKPNEHPIIAGYNRLDYVPVEGIRVPEPISKHLLADAKVGDLCKRRDGKYVQIIRIDTCHKRPYRYRDNEYGGVERGVTVAGSWICDDNDKRSFDIIATEPLAPEGTAEWARQMMKLGNKVRNRDWDDGTHEKSLLYCQLIGETIKYNEGCSAFDVCLSDWEAPYIKNTGWQLYAEPEPAMNNIAEANDILNRVANDPKIVMVDITETELSIIRDAIAELNAELNTYKLALENAIIDRTLGGNTPLAQYVADARAELNRQAQGGAE